MEQHAIPRQVTTFEFKLIGFMTLKQFLYLVVFFPLAYVFFALFPIPLVNILLAFLCVGIGLAFAFYTIYDRPLDVWLKNFLRRLNSPTQFFYHKHNNALNFLKGLYFVSDPHHVLAHIEAQEKLAAYIASTTPKPAKGNNKKQDVQALLKTPMAQLKPAPAAAPAPTPVPVQQPAPQPAPQPVQVVQPVASPRHPFFLGVIKNNRKIPLPGILVYVKDGNNTPLRLLKTNPHGVFATYNALPPGEYQIEVKDPNGSYFFDTIKIPIGSSNPTPIEISSKEML